MGSLDMDRLGKTIEEALDLITVLRTENDVLMEDREKARKNLQQPEQVKGKTSVADQLKVDKEVLQRLQHERIAVKKKIRNILRKIEGIHLKEDRPQKDLFDTE